MLKEWNVYDNGVFVGRVMARNEEYAKSEARMLHRIEGKLEVLEQKLAPSISKPLEVGEDIFIPVDRDQT